MILCDLAGVVVFVGPLLFLFLPFCVLMLIPFYRNIFFLLLSTLPVRFASDVLILFLTSSLCSENKAKQIVCKYKVISYYKQKENVIMVRKNVQNKITG